MVEQYHTSPYVFMAWYLIKHKNNFSSTLAFSAEKRDIENGTEQLVQ
jgi:hypothetical protein